MVPGSVPKRTRKDEDIIIRTLIEFVLGPTIHGLRVANAAAKIADKWIRRAVHLALVYIFGVLAMSLIAGMHPRFATVTILPMLATGLVLTFVGRSWSGRTILWFTLTALGFFEGLGICFLALQPSDYNFRIVAVPLVTLLPFFTLLLYVWRRVNILATWIAVKSIPYVREGLRRVAQVAGVVMIIGLSFSFWPQAIHWQDIPLYMLAVLVATLACLAYLVRKRGASGTVIGTVATTAPPPITTGAVPTTSSSDYGGHSGGSRLVEGKRDSAGSTSSPEGGGIAGRLWDTLFEVAAEGTSVIVPETSEHKAERHEAAYEAGGQEAREEKNATTSEKAVNAAFHALEDFYGDLFGRTTEQASRDKGRHDEKKVKQSRAGSS